MKHPNHRRWSTGKPARLVVAHASFSHTFRVSEVVHETIHHSNAGATNDPARNNGGWILRNLMEPQWMFIPSFPMSRTSNHVWGAQKLALGTVQHIHRTKNPSPKDLVVFDQKILDWLVLSHAQLWEVCLNGGICISALASLPISLSLSLPFCICNSPPRRFERWLASFCSSPLSKTMIVW